MSPQIYGLGVQQRVESMRANAMTLSHTQRRMLHDPSLAECTFRPHTNFTVRRKPRPSSAVHEQAPGAAFDLSEYADLLARYGLHIGIQLAMLVCQIQAFPLSFS